MQRLEPAVREDNPGKMEEIIQDILKTFPQFTREQVEKQVEEESHLERFINDKYQVTRRPAQDGVIWLSIKRSDKEPIHDWRDLQEIKNQLVGTENEAIEIYPAESRCVDTANQYHLWVFADPEYRIPFGFHEGRLVTSEHGRHDKQRPLENGV
jgi:hypothetical protein